MGKHKILLSLRWNMETKPDNSAVIHVNSKSWDHEILRSTLPVLVDFWAEWCGPCRMVGPAVEQIGRSLSGKIKVAKLNVDESQDIAIKYGVQSIPSLILYKDGKELGRTIGAAPKETYMKFIDNTLKAS